MKLRRMLALTLVLMTLTTAALAENHSGFYQPQENAAMDYDDSESRWSFARSAESEHFLLFWEAEFGENPLNAAPEMRVDTADLLEKAELFYTENVERLHMADEPLPWAGASCKSTCCIRRIGSRRGRGTTTASGRYGFRPRRASRSGR